MVNHFDRRKQAARANPDYDPEWWFAPKDSPEATAAQGICMHECPVYEQCGQCTRAVDLRAPGGITGIRAGCTYREHRRSAGRQESKHQHDKEQTKLKGSDMNGEHESRSYMIT